MTVDTTLADLSDALFSVSVGLYSLAVVAFCAQLAFGRRPAVRRRCAHASTFAQAFKVEQSATP